MDWKEILRSKIKKDMSIIQMSDSRQTKEELFAEEYPEERLKEMYDDSLDEMGDIKIGTLTFSPSRVLREVDPIAYRTGLSEYEDFLLQDFEYDEGDEYE